MFSTLQVIIPTTFPISARTPSTYSLPWRPFLHFSATCSPSGYASKEAKASPPPLERFSESLLPPSEWFLCSSSPSWPLRVTFRSVVWLAPPCSPQPPGGSIPKLAARWSCCSSAHRRCSSSLATKTTSAACWLGTKTVLAERKQAPREPHRR